MPHITINPSIASQYDRSQAKLVKLPAGKRADINIAFSSPVNENAATVFDLTNGEVGVAHRNNQQATPQYGIYGPFASDVELLIVASHKDGPSSPQLPWHQSWIRTYRETPTEVRFGSSDAGVPQGNFSQAHAQITIELI